MGFASPVPCDHVIFAPGPLDTSSLRNVPVVDPTPLEKINLMILDRIENACLYYRLGDRLEAALRALKTEQLIHAGIGRHELRGPDIFALVQEFQTRPRELGKWEAHRRYIDIQFVASGVEVIGHTDVNNLTVIEPYREKEDIAFFTGDGSFMTLTAGMFAIFFPHDAHMPCLALALPGPVRKIVLKVRADETNPC
jgi:biofilm protein TabA